MNSEDIIPFLYPPSEIPIRPKQVYPLKWQVDSLNLNGTSHKPKLAIVCDKGYVHMLLNVRAINQVAEISYGFSPNLRLVMFIPVNSCLKKKNWSVWAASSM